MMRGNKRAHLCVFVFVNTRMLCYPGAVMAIVAAAPLVATAYATQRALLQVISDIQLPGAKRERQAE